MVEVTQDQIDAWKKEYNNDVTKISVGDKAMYLKFPDRKTLSYATQLAKKDPLAFNQYIIDKCFIGGDEDFKTNPRLFYSVMQKLDEFLNAEEAKLEKL